MAQKLTFYICVNVSQTYILSVIVLNIVKKKAKNGGRVFWWWLLNFLFC